MKKKLLAFGASNSSTSINKQLAKYAAGLFKNAQVDLLDLNDYEMPIYSYDREKKDGFPQLANDFYKKIGEADFILISFAEHNGAYSTAFKNIFDWMSRINGKTFQEKANVIASHFARSSRRSFCFGNCKQSFSKAGWYCKRHFFIAKF